MRSVAPHPVVLCLLCLLVLLTPVLSAQEPGAGTAEQARGSAAAPDPFPPPDYEVVPRVLALQEEAAAVRRELSTLRDVEPLADEARQLSEREEALDRRFELLPQGHVLSVDQIAQLRVQTEKSHQLLEALLETVSQRFRRLEEIRQTWEERRAFFRRWRSHLRGNPDEVALQSELDRAVQLIDDVVAEIVRSRPDVAGLQQDIQSRLQENRVLLDRIASLAADWENRLRSRTVPFIFSGDFAARLDAALDSEMRSNLGQALRVESVFLVDNSNLIALQILIFLAVALGGRRLRHLTEGSRRWQSLLSHPWALGAFTSVVIVGSYYEPAPGLWRLLLTFGLAASIGLLAHSTFRRSRRRWSAYLLAVIYFLFQAGEALALPTPLYRLLLLALCLVPIPVFLYLAGREAREEGNLSPFALILRASSLALGLVALGEVMGYHVLARWILESALETTFLVFVIIFLIRLARTVLTLVFQGAWVERSSFWRRVRDEVQARLSRIAQLILVLVGILYALSFWDLDDSPIQVWRRMVSWSFPFGSIEIAFGQILLGAMALYLAFIASRLIRVLVDTQVAPDHSLEKGVSDSIKTLLHYTLILLGFLFALSFLGIPIQSFAIVAGALGVGIGFGLQDVVNNFLSGLILLFERPVRVGDTVIVEGTWGTIQRIGLRSTLIQTFDRSELIVPNGKLISQTVTNWTLSNRVARSLLTVGVAYGSDYARVQEVLREVCAAHQHVLEEPEPVVTLAAFADSSVNFEIRAWIDDIDNRLATVSELHQGIARRFAEEGITIPFPQRDLHLRWIDPPAGPR